jgi:hypothetical protein
VRLFHPKETGTEIEDLAALMGELTSRAKDFLGRPVRTHIIDGSASGKRIRAPGLREFSPFLRTVLFDTAQNTAPNPDASLRFHGGGCSRISAAEIAAEIREENGRGSKDPADYFVITLCTDAAYKEVLGEFLELPADICKRLTLFRLPLGMGDGGADIRVLTSAVRILLEGGRRKELSFLKVNLRGGKVLNAFTLLSYERMRRTPPLFIELHSAGRDKKTLRGRFILLALGAAGRQICGDGKRILPDDNNFCAVREVGDKQILQKLLREGKHPGFPGVESEKVDSLRLMCSGSIRLRIDGEDCRLKPEDFPCEIEIVSSPLWVLQEKI